MATYNINKIKLPNGDIVKLVDETSGYAKSSEVPTVVDTYSSTGTDAVSGKAVNAALQTLDSSITATTGQAISAITITDGKISGSNKISVGDANQNAFSNVKVGSSTIAADTTTDTIELVAGTDITLTPDTTNDKVTIAFNNNSGYTTNTGTVTSVGLQNATNGGLSVSGSPITSSGTISVGHSNILTNAQTTQALYPIAIDKNGHISSYGTAVDPEDIYYITYTESTDTIDRSASEVASAYRAGKYLILKYVIDNIDTGYFPFGGKFLVSSVNNTISYLFSAANVNDNGNSSSAFIVTYALIDNGSSTLTLQELAFAVAEQDHSHGNINFDGTISSTAVTPGNGDYILISDSSGSNKIERGIAIGTNTIKYLRNDGTWTVPAKAWYGTCSTTASTAEKSVTCPDFSLVTGNIIGIYFATANTAATPTLNVNSTGAKSINVGGDAVNSTTNVLKWSAYTILYFYYTGSSYQYITSISPATTKPSRGAGTWYGTSDTAASTQAKTSTIDNYVLTLGSLAVIKFTYANTYTSAKITLNINSTGAKDVYYNGAVTSSTNTLKWEAGETVTFIYDGTGYYFVSKSKGGAVTDVQIGGTSILNSGIANIITNTAYNSSTNKIATMSDISDTKVTNTLATTTQYYVTGTTSTSTNTGTQSFDTGVFVTTTAGQLQATSYKVTSNATIQWNSTDSSIDFVF